jgi:hypothetical protein
MRSRNAWACYVALLLTALLLVHEAPAAEAGFGCFVEKGRLTTPWDRTCLDMAGVGMTTMAFYPTSDADLVYQVETALTTGMLRKDIPIILVSNMPTRTPGPDNTNEKEWEDLPKRCDEARAKAPHGKDWPEIILYGTDEPTSAEQVKSWSASYHKGGYRCTTALCVPNVQDFIPYLDLLILHASPGVLTRANVDAIAAAGKQFGVYNVQLRLASPELMRYYAGLWTYKLKPVVNLMWEWQWFAEDNPRGPASKAALAGYAQGTADYRLLRELEAYPLDLDFWPGICGAQREAWKKDFNGTAGRCRPSNPLAVR